uniref:NADH dehydrogenase subunit 1 n=1 Tax=Parascaris univalens TaxID=6257 RepID=A0A915B246_PARUN
MHCVALRWRHSNLVYFSYIYIHFGSSEGDDQQSML